jgi:hypothetical protein
MERVKFRVSRVRLRVRAMVRVRVRARVEARVRVRLPCRYPLESISTTISTIYIMRDMHRALGNSIVKVYTLLFVVSRITQM